MDKKKSQPAQDKQNVKFAQTTQIEQVPVEILVSSQRPKVIYKSWQECRDVAINTFSKIDQEFKVLTDTDRKIQRLDTAKALQYLLDILKDLLHQLNLGTYNDKVKNYYLTYNSTIYLLDICQFLRQSVYTSVVIDYIAFAIVSLEGNQTLRSIKYLEWRVKLYLELAQCYQELGCLQSAQKTFERCLTKIQESKELQDLDPPVADYIEKIFRNNLRIVNALDLKLKLQNNTITVDAWKKRIEEIFTNDKSGRILTVIESLRTNNIKFSNTVEQQGKQFQWKIGAVQSAYDIFKNDVETIALALQQLSNDFEDKRPQSTEQQVKQPEQMDKIDEKTWKNASQNIPLEFHIELCHYAYEIGNQKIFDDFTRTALIRCKHRRIETPYIKNIQFLTSSTPFPTPPEGWDIVPIDINEASLRMELRKLRNKNKGKNKQQQEEKKEEPQKKDDKKGTKQPAQQQQQQQEEQKQGIHATQEELDIIKHVYVYLIIERSLEPVQALYKIDVIIAQEKVGVNDDIYKYLEFPVDQYTGVQETNHTTPWLCLRNSTDDLQDENQKKNLIIDVVPLFGKSPQIRPSFGYTKILTDIRQTPKEFIKSPNMEYVYLTYKTDRQFYSNERELQILICLQKLEKSYGVEKLQSCDDEKKVHLDLIYNLEFLDKLVSVMSNSLDGPLGEQFYSDRSDFLVNLCFFIWKKYIKSQLFQIDFVFELKIAQEISEIDFITYNSLIKQAKIIFIQTLKMFNQVLMRNPKTDILLLCKINLELCKLLEESGEYKQATQNLRSCLPKITRYRDQLLERGVESQKDYFVPFCLTTNNIKISNTINKMKESYIESKNKLNQEIRIYERKKRAKDKGSIKENLLEKDEEQEEEYEYLEANLMCLGDDNKDSKYFEALDQHNQYTETEMIINALHTDILINLYRCELKVGREMQKANNLQIKELQSLKEEKDETYMVKSQAKRLLQIPTSQLEQLEGIADKDKIKTTLMQGETAQTIKKNQEILTNTLQKAGYREPPKPQTNNYEAYILQETNDNTYQKALLMMVLAQNKQKLPEQQYLLTEAFKLIQQSEQMEDMHLQNSIEDAIYILSTLLDNKETRQNSMNFFPFDHLYKARFTHPNKKPRKPVLISRNSQSITFKFPPFKPLLSESTLRDDPNKEKIISMAIFGKKSQNRVDVAETCKDLHNTGIRQEIGAIVTIKNLEQNQKYCFAVSGYDANEELSNSIGVTSEDIVCLHPLPINQLYSYLAKIAYQIEDFNLSEKACNQCFEYFTDKSEFLDRTLNFEPNPLYILRLKQSTIKKVSLLEIGVLTETFIIKARCLKRRFFLNGDKTSDTTQIKPQQIQIEHQKNILQVCNYLIMAVETCLITSNYIQGKRLASEIYNTIYDVLGMSNQTTFVFHILLKTQILISMIQKEYWDRNLRILSAKICYEIMRISLQLNEINLGKRVLYSEAKLFNRKWYTFSRIVMVEESQDKRDDKKGGKKDTKKETKKGGKKEDAKEQNEVQEEQVKIIPQLVRDLYETPTSLQSFLEQTLLSFPEEYGDYVQRFVENWKEAIENFLQYVENSQTEKDKMVQELSSHLEFWDTFKDINTAYTKIQSNFKTSSLYLEICCRLFKRLLENGTDPKYVYECINQMSDFPLCESIKTQEEILKLKRTAIENNIEWYPNMVGELIKYHDTNKQGFEEAIKIFKLFFEKNRLLNQQLNKEDYTVHITFTNNYQNLFLSQKNLFHSISQFLMITNHQPKELNTKIYYEIFQINQKQFIQEIQEEKKVPKIGQSIDKNRMNSIKNIISQLSLASFYSCNAQSWLQLQNILRVTYNIIVYELLNPFMHQGQTIWQDFTLLCYSALQMLEQIKQYGMYPLRQKLKNEKNTRPETRDPKNKPQTSNSQNRNVQFEEIKQDDQYPCELPVLDNSLSQTFWFQSEKILNIELIANLIGYTIQLLTLEQKWNILIGITRTFCNITNHFYSQQILPFTIHAQTILYTEAHEKTEKKQEELTKVTLVYEEWKANYKRRRTRQALITGEVAQEELDYQRDKTDLENQINKLLTNENFIKNEKEISESILKQLERDSNQFVQQLKESRNLMYLFGSAEAQNVKEFDISTIVNDSNQKKNKNVTKQLGVSAQKKYKETSDQLFKRQETKFLGIQAKKELGNINYAIAMGHTPGAYMGQQTEDSWRDALDGIFSKQVDTLKNYRKVLNDFGPNIAHTLGIKPILVGVNLLNNLSQICYFKDLHHQRDAIQMAADLAFSLFRITLPHPQVYICLANYRLKEISQKEDVFKDKYTLDPSETMLSCYKIGILLLDSEIPLKSLPLFCIMDYIATDILLSAFFSMRAKIMRSIALAMNGLINESYQFLQRAYHEKDLPLCWQQQSEWMKREKGNNWYFQEQGFNNSGHPYEEQNKQITEKILNNMELPKDFSIKFGQMNYNLFVFARILLLFSIHQNEIFEMHEKNETRREYLKKGEEKLRELLKKLSFEEELEFLNYKIDIHKIVAAEEISNDNSCQEVIEKTKQEIQQLFIRRNITDKIDQENYLSNREESLDYVSKREERLQLMARIRFLMVQMNNSLQLYQRSYWILKYAIVNLLNYSKEHRMVETGEEPEIEAFDNLKPQGEEVGKPGIKGKQQPVQAKKEEQKKATTGKDKVDSKQEEERARQDEQKKEELQLEQEQALKYSDDRKGRRHLSGLWIIKLKSELINVLYYQNKFDDSSNKGSEKGLIEKTKADCKVFKENYFYRKILEVQARCLIKKGQFEEALKMFDDIIVHSKQYNQNDENFVKILGDLGEISFERGELDQAQQFFENALNQSEQILAEQCYNHQPQNYNQKAFQEDIQTLQELQLTNEQEDEILQKQDRTGQQKGGKKDEKKGKDDKKGKQQDKKQQQKEESMPEMKVEPLKIMANYNFMNDIKHSFNSLEKENTNNTKIVYNIYTRGVILYIRCVLRYVNCKLISNPLHNLDDNIKNLLVKVDQIIQISKNFLVPISLRFEVEHLFGQYYRKKFEQQVQNIQNEYIKKYIDGKHSKDDEVKTRTKKYQSLASKKPYRDLCRNKYMIEVPNFSQILKENLQPLLEESIKHYENSLSLFQRSECLFFENARRVEDIFMEVAEVHLLKREYTVRVGFKYIQLDEYQKKIDMIKENEAENASKEKVDVISKIEASSKYEKTEQQKNEIDAFTKMTYAIIVTEMKNYLINNFSELSLTPLSDVSKIPLDLFYDIIESDYMYKMEQKNIQIQSNLGNEEIILFDESKRKQNISSIDLLMLLLKLNNESKIMTFCGPHLQNKITKLHRYLKNCHTTYSQKCMLTNIDTQSQINEGSIIIKSLEIKSNSSEEYKFIYIFSGLDKSKLVVKEEFKQEVDKIILNTEKENLYGNLYINAKDLDRIMQSILDLKSKMEISDKKKDQAKQRDYKYHRKNFKKIIEEFGSYFFLSEKEQKKSAQNTQKAAQQGGNKTDDDENSILKRFVIFIPEVNMDMVEIFYRIFNQNGFKGINHNLLAIFRYFHHSKYQ